MADLERERYEAESEKVIAANNELLKLFEDDLTSSGVSAKTVRSHIDNAEFFINAYLMMGSVREMTEGPRMAESYLGEFYACHCVWSSPTSVRNTAVSIKRFYKCMADHGKIPRFDYENMCACIKANLDQWISNCRKAREAERGALDGLLCK